MLKSLETPELSKHNPIIRELAQHKVLVISLKHYNSRHLGDGGGADTYDAKS
jgi:hypothetical protein